MPITDGKYVAPTWVNSTTPPIDSDELQDICDSIESYADPFTTVPSVPRPNILDNWYFAGGGSQKGGGQFPINQLGKTSYSGAVQYTIDRWKTSNTNTSVVISNSGLTLSSTSESAAYLLQKIENIAQFRNKTVTLSAFVEGVCYSASATIPASNPGSSTIYASIENICHILYLSNAWYVRLVCPAEDEQTYTAVKLELGSIQTLAHQENGSWVINEVPSFDIQFARCSELPSVPARYESGSYVGTGTSGSSNPSSLTFGFVPKLVMIRNVSNNQYCLFNAINGCETIRVDIANSSGIAYLTWSGFTLQWYGTGSSSQQNVGDEIYYYTAIG